MLSLNELERLAQEAQNMNALSGDIFNFGLTCRRELPQLLAKMRKLERIAELAGSLMSEDTMREAASCYSVAASLVEALK